MTDVMSGQVAIILMKPLFRDLRQLGASQIYNHVNCAKTTTTTTTVEYHGQTVLFNS